eukprot:jgi/Botrbrau1/11226/Bobra.0075s0022.1
MIHRVTSNTQQLPMELGRSSSTGLESHSGTGAVSRIFMPAEDWKVPVCQASTPTNCGICGCWYQSHKVTPALHY